MHQIELKDSPCLKGPDSKLKKKKNRNIQNLMRPGYGENL